MANGHSHEAVMRSAHRTGIFHRVLQVIAIAFVVAAASAAQAQRTTLDDLVSAVVRIKTFINPDGTSVSNLGREREGSGIVIDESGLVLTIGYLMVEAQCRRDHHQRRPDPGGDRGRLRPRDRLRPLAHARAAEDQAARLRPIGRRQGAGPGAGGELWRRRCRAAGPHREPPRVHRELGVSGRGRDLHQPAASGLERGCADQPRGQADRRRLA